MNTLAARAGIVVQTGAQVIAAQPLGVNRFVLTTDSDAPVVQGTVNPAATIVIDDGLPASHRVRQLARRRRRDLRQR